VRLLKDKKGDSTFLFLLFLLVVSVMFLHAISVISHNIALRSHMNRVSEEIALNVAAAGMDMTAAMEGRTEINEEAANDIAREVLQREGATDATYVISLSNGAVLVEMVFEGIRATSEAQTLNIQ
jgi:hypothetical protein